MANFLKAFSKIMPAEGGYVNHALDRGGETYKGISRNYHGTWPGWILIERYKRLPNFPDNLEESQSLKDHVQVFYKSNFWDINKLDLIQNQDIAEELFDTGVNMGTKIAAEFLQKAYNLLSKNGVEYDKISVDGIIGNKTLSAINNHKYPKRIFKTLNILQGSRYISICEKDPSQEEFFAGWISRVEI